MYVCGTDSAVGGYLKIAYAVSSILRPPSFLVGPQEDGTKLFLWQG